MHPIKLTQKPTNWSVKEDVFISKRLDPKWVKQIQEGADIMIEELKWLKKQPVHIDRRMDMISRIFDGLERLNNHVEYDEE